MKHWRYYVATQADASWLVIIVAWGVMFGLLLGNVYRLTPTRRVEDTFVIFSLFLPLALGLLVAKLPPQELAARTHELFLTYRQRPWLRLLWHVVLASVTWVALVTLSGVLVDHLYATISLRWLAGSVLPPGLALGGMGLALSALTRSRVGGVLGATIWFGMDFIAPGLNRLAYLYSRVQPLPGVDPQIMDQRLMIIGAAGLAVSLFLAERRARWIAGS